MTPAATQAATAAAMKVVTAAATIVATSAVQAHALLRPEDQSATKTATLLAIQAAIHVLRVIAHKMERTVKRLAPSVRNPSSDSGLPLQTMEAAQI